MQKSELVREILTYLVEHPDAQDTFDGIAQWWIPEQKIKSQIANIKEAITELVAQEFILERQGKDSRTRYQVNRRKRKKIEAFLK